MFINFRFAILIFVIFAVFGISNQAFCKEREISSKKPFHVFVEGGYSSVSEGAKKFYSGYNVGITGLINVATTQVVSFVLGGGVNYETLSAYYQ